MFRDKARILFGIKSLSSLTLILPAAEWWNFLAVSVFVVILVEFDKYTISSKYKYKLMVKQAG